MWTVYQIKCLSNGKCYVGSTVNYQRRKKRHITELRYGYHHSLRLTEDFKTYGESSLEFSVIEMVPTLHEARIAEGKWIEKLDTYNNGYNNTLSGKHFDLPKEVRQKIHREKITPQSRTDEHREKCRRRAVAQYATEEARKAHSDRQKEIIAQDPEKWAEVAKRAAKKGGDANREKSRKPIMRSDGKRYDAIIDAARDMRPNEVERARACLKQALKNKSFSMGFYWRYLR